MSPGVRFALNFSFWTRLLENCYVFAVGRESLQFARGISVKLIGRVAVAAAIVASAAPAWAQSNTASTNTNGSATIVAPITLTENTPLRFGTVVRPTSGSNTVTLGTAGCTPGLSGAGNAAILSSTSGCATYSAGGEDGLAFNISTDANFALTRSGGSETLTVTLTKSANTGIIGAASANFKVGGSFAVDSNTVAGAYSGSFTTTVTYQ